MQTLSSPDEPSNATCATPKMSMQKHAGLPGGSGVNSQAASCLQTREYQTTIIIGGEEMDAYGTACLQPDGSWLQGPARAVPDF